MVGWMDGWIEDGYAGIVRNRKRGGGTVGIEEKVKVGLFDNCQAAPSSFPLFFFSKEILLCDVSLVRISGLRISDPSGLVLLCSPGQLLRPCTLSILQQRHRFLFPSLCHENL